MLQHLLFVLVQLQLLEDQLVPLDELAGRKAHRQPRALGVVLNEVADRVQAAVHRAAVVVRVAEILAQRLFLKVGNMNGMPHQLVHALILCCGDRDHRNSQHGFHGIDVHGAAVAGHLVHHVQRHDHRAVHLQKLHGQIQVPLDVGRIDDIDDRLRASPVARSPGRPAPRWSRGTWNRCPAGP